jgi:hypothetical protein
MSIFEVMMAVVLLLLVGDAVNGGGHEGTSECGNVFSC